MLADNWSSPRPDEADQRAIRWRIAVSLPEVAEALGLSIIDAFIAAATGRLPGRASGNWLLVSYADLRSPHRGSLSAKLEGAWYEAFERDVNVANNNNLRCSDARKAGEPCPCDDCLAGLWRPSR